MKSTSRPGNELYQLLVEQVEDYAIFALDTTGHIISWNLGAERFKGYSAVEITGRHFSVFYPQVDLDNGKPAFELAQAMVDGRFEDEGWRVRKDGSQFWANVVITPIRDHSGKHIGFAKVTRDLTARKEGEEQARKLAAEAAGRSAVEEKNRELEQLAGQLRSQKQDLEKANSKLTAALSRAEELHRQATIAEEKEHDARATAEAANRAKAEFLAAMSHELRTPLNALDEQREALTRIKRAEQHLLHLIDDLLNFARIESGRVEYHNTRVALADVVADVGPMIIPQISAKKLSYSIELGDQPVWVSADRAKLIQIVLNLIGNAVKFTEAGGTIRVHMCDPDEGDSSDSAYLCVSDTGTGIPSDKLQTVFDPFVQLATSHSERHEGTGLGLAISRDLARGMGGDLRARPHDGKGTTFVVVLSRAD